MQPNHDHQPPSSEEVHTPIVSIGMPVYNGARHIRVALDSLLAQTHTDFELIISDNASTDGTEAICREYALKDPRVRYFRQADNRGSAANFWFVLENAKATYFMWAAHDDLWMPTFVAATLRKLEANPQAVCVASQVRFSDGNLSRATFPITGMPRQRLRAFLSHPSDNSRIYGLYRIECARWAFPEKVWNSFAGDWALVATVAIAGEILEVPEVLMVRLVAETGRYFSTLSKKGFLVSCFPLLPFSVHVLKHKEAWSLGSLNRLFRLNVMYHVDMAAYCGWFTYPVYRAVYRIVLKRSRIAAQNSGLR